ncbi:hypothetical protein RJ639_007014 [Escallonia herrerae]|uniref:ARM repeat superfamily protein n=1 Tax=Escallonia herrerae TaxID=1293975 RepID=A0AA88VZ09_9ASTE|nr:hypothetical protein RJ639_007014 [Escallonia herrerae]
MIMHRKLLEEVNRECQLEPSSIIYVRRFFYDTYSACVNESIFYGRQKDLVSFAMDLLASNVFEDQLNGARILRKFATNEKFSDTTLQKVGIATSVMARLVEMLNWKEVEEEEIRQSAAEILLKLEGPRHKAPQVAGIQGVMESISSLLLDSRDPAAASDGIPVTMMDFQLERCDLLEFVNLGLRILKKLSRDHGSCGKIGNTRGLLPKIINFTYADERLLKGERTTPTQILTVKRSLQVLKMLASTRGTTGNVIKELFNIYLKQEMPAGPEHLNRVKVAAGEALSTLTLAGTSNCHRILRLKVIGNLVRGLEDRVLRLSAARILRNLRTYSGGGFFDQLRDVVAAAPIVLKEISREDKKLQEVMVGLAAQVFKFMTSQESSAVFERVGIQEAQLARMLVQILKFHQYPLVTCPNMRRFTRELAICLMREKDKNVQHFKDLGMEKELEHVVETTSPLESFGTFSDSVGLSQHSTPIHSLVETAMELLAGKEVALKTTFQSNLEEPTWVYQPAEISKMVGYSREGSTHLQVLEFSPDLDSVTPAPAYNYPSTGARVPLVREIPEMVFTISNIRDCRSLVRATDRRLQLLGIEILTSLTLEEDARELIGCTGGVIKELFNTHSKQDMPEDLNRVRVQTEIETPIRNAPINFRWYSCVPGAKLTSFASWLAMLEKAAAGLGALGFIWASGVLLGGFASSLAKEDFWFINVILLIEGIRIFSRRQIIRWQHDAPWTLTRAVRKCLWAIKFSVRFVLVKLAKVSRRRRGTQENEIQEIETLETTLRRRRPTWTKYTTISQFLYCFQIASSITCVILSSMKLFKHLRGDVGNTNARNQQLALNIFYLLALAEALLFLSEKAYSEWMIMHRKVLDEMNKECQLEPSDIIYVRRFFYDAYSTCVNGSIFDGLQKDMVSFAMDLLASSVLADQLSGAVILQKFAKNYKFSFATLQKVGITTSVMARLVEMLNWKEPEQREIRQAAAEILVKLAGRKHKPLQVAGIPGVMESILSLLSGSAAASGEISLRTSRFRYEHHDFSSVTLGLRLLKKLSRDHGSCEKIGNTRGLLPKIIYFTYADERQLNDEGTTPAQNLILEQSLQVVERSLQVVKMLASTTGTTGKQLRKEISEVVFTISNIRGLLQHGEKHQVLRLLSIAILTILAAEEDGRELIGCTGNVIKELFNIYLEQRVPEYLYGVKVAAGEALSMLTLKSTSNCHRTLKLKVIENLVRGLEDQNLRLNAARILRNLCIYSGGGCFDQLRDVVAAAPIVLEAIIMEEKELQEVMVGLAAQLFKFMTSQESSAVFERAGIQEAKFAGVLVLILRNNKYPSVRCLTMRRFVVELAICLMRVKDADIATFKDLGMVEELQSVVETTSQIESFYTFSGTVGLSRHSMPIHSLVETAMELLNICS